MVGEPWLRVVARRVIGGERDERWEARCTKARKAKRQRREETPYKLLRLGGRTRWRGGQEEKDEGINVQDLAYGRESNMGVRSQHSPNTRRTSRPRRVFPLGVFLTRPLTPPRRRLPFPAVLVLSRTTAEATPRHALGLQTYATPTKEASVRCPARQTKGDSFAESLIRSNH